MSMRIDIRRFVTFSLRMFYRRHHDLVNSYGISVSQMNTDMFNLLIITIRYFPRAIISNRFITRVARLVPLAKQEQLILPEHIHLGSSSVCIAQSV
jgi:hypothetical protein